MRVHIGSAGLAICLLSRVAFGQMCNPQESLIACQNRLQWEQNWADVGKSLQEGAARRQFNQDINAARAKFWATYPDKPGFAAARDRFVGLLDTKDRVYLIENLSTLLAQKVSPNPGVDPKALAKFDDMIGGDPLDHGISPGAQSEFEDFVSAVAEHIQQHGGVLTPAAVSNSQQALAESKPEYARYIAARDWAEFDAAGRVPVAYAQPRAYATMLYTRFGQLPEAGGVAFVNSMVKVFGADAVDAATKHVMAAPKDGNSNPLKTFEALAASGDDRRYLLWMLAPNANALPGVTKWDRASNAYDKLAWAFGDAELLGAAHEARGTPNDPYHAFENAVTRKDPRGYVRAVIAFSQNVTSKAALDAAYRDFLTGKDEATVLAAAGKLAAYRPDVMADYPQLTGALKGKPADGSTVDNWQYVAWKGFSVGAKATYRDHATFTLEAVDDTRARVVLAEGTPPHQTESEYPSRTPAVGPRGSATVETGEETMAIAGRSLKTRWQSVTIGTETEKIWLSDEVPGGLVRKLTTTGGRMVAGRQAPPTSREQILESFQGTRQGGTTDIFAVRTPTTPATPSPDARESPRALRRSRAAAASTDTSAH